MPSGGGYIIRAVCFGHQLIAHALGGEVGGNPNGASFGNVRVSKAAKVVPDPLFDSLPDSMEMKVFHYQSVVKLPEGANILANSPRDPYYAVRYADNVWGVQFHPEFDCEILERTIDVYATDMFAAGFDVDDLRALNKFDSSGHKLLQRFIEISELQNSKAAVD